LRWLSFAYDCSLFPPHCHHSPPLTQLILHFVQTRFSLPYPREAHESVTEWSRSSISGNWYFKFLNYVDRNKEIPNHMSQVKDSTTWESFLVILSIWRARDSRLITSCMYDSSKGNLWKLSCIKRGDNPTIYWGNPWIPTLSSKRIKTEEAILYGILQFRASCKKARVLSAADDIIMKNGKI
jgi:hypothetical protein